MTQNFYASLQKRARPRRCFLLFAPAWAPLTHGGGQSFLGWPRQG